MLCHGRHWHESRASMGGAVRAGVSRRQEELFDKITLLGKNDWTVGDLECIFQ